MNSKQGFSVTHLVIFKGVILYHSVSCAIHAASRLKALCNVSMRVNPCYVLLRVNPIRSLGCIVKLCGCVAILWCKTLYRYTEDPLCLL